MNINRSRTTQTEVHEYDVHGAEATQLGYYKGPSIPYRLVVKYRKHRTASEARTATAEITILASNVLTSGHPGNQNRDIHYHRLDEAPEWAQRTAADGAPWQDTAA